MDKKLEATLKELSAKLGPGVLRSVSTSSLTPVSVLSTGSLMINKATGIGGYPRGRIIEIFGPESSGKTTLALHAVAECQKQNGVVAYIDTENALDMTYAKSLGVKTNDLLISQPDSGEQALDVIAELIRTNEVDLIIVDSVAAMVPNAEVNTSMEDQTIGAHARMMSKGLRIINSLLSKSNTIVIFINQLREKIGVIYGNPEITTGGRALRFYASMRLEVRKDSLIKNLNETLGLKSKITIVKNKMAQPFGIAFIDIFFGKGFDYGLELIEYGVITGIIEKSGTWYSYKDKRIGQGKTQVKQYLTDHNDVFVELQTDISKQLSPINH